jgi:hypothetical protein
MLIAVGGAGALLAAALAGLDDTATVTVALSGLAALVLGYRIDRLQGGWAVQFYASAVCILGATVAGQGYVAVELGVLGEHRSTARLLVAAGVLMAVGGFVQLARAPLRRSA